MVCCSKRHLRDGRDPGQPVGAEGAVAEEDAKQLVQHAPW